MNSFRSPVYLTVGADATGVFCRDSGLVQDGLSLPIALAAPPGQRELPTSRQLPCGLLSGSNPNNPCQMILMRAGRRIPGDMIESVLRR